MQVRTLFGSIACLLVSAVTAQQVTPVPYKSTVKPSYVRSWEAAAPEKNGNTLTGRPVKDVRQSTQYFDGLGRPIQIVVKQGSQATGKTAGDFVSPVEYDAFGREVYSYLPFAANATGGNTSLNDGQFKYNPFQQDSVFNKLQYPGETFYYSKKNFESSPQSRELESYAPGNSWVGSENNPDANARRNISNLYLVNSVSDSVRIWNWAGSSFTSTSMYADGLLFKNVSIDEHKKQVIEFKDKTGNTILKKVQIATTPSSGHTGWLCTYYLYDELDNLRLVIQPKGVELLMGNSWNLAALSGSILNEFCFRYEFDEKNRMVEKKVPGAGVVWMVYDARDRLVLTQDSANRGSSTKKWLYTQYDGLNRPVASGLWNNTSDRAYHKAQAYNSVAYPNLSGQTYEELSRIYYDDYNWAASLPAAVKDFSISDISSHLQAASNTTWPYPQAVQKSATTFGLTTGSKVKVLGSNPAKVLVTVNFYDDKGRVIQIRSQNITDGVDVVTTQYTWSGQPLVIVQKQEKGAPNAQSHIIVTKFTYDDLGRLLTVKKSVNSTINGGNISKPEQVIASHEYDALGQLAKKTLGTPIIDSMRYDYNIRGWLLGANRAYAKDAHQNNYFGFDLGYDKTNNGLIGNQAYVAPQYNGNITGTVWKSKGDGEKRKYDFGYDAANRILKANFTQYTGTTFNTSAELDFTVKDLTYDANGNIGSMTQRGWKLGGSVTIDSLLYTYDNSNKLKNVIDRNNDVQTKLGDFRSSSLYMTALLNNKTTAAVDYVYDGNGNMVRDRNKDIGDATNNGITYNHLNLPSVVTVRTTAGAVKGTVTYSYDALGNKLRKTVVETGKPTRTTLYLGGAVYENDTLQFLAQEEGRLRYAKQYYQNGNSDYRYFYDYFLKDHLGNVRMVLTEQKDTAVYIATMEAAYRAKEDSLFYNIPETSYPSAAIPGGYPADVTTVPNDSLARVNGSGRKVGPSLVLRVMSGDKVDLAVKSFYQGSGPAGPTSDPVADILSALAGGIVGTAGESKGAFSQLSNPSTSPLAGILNSFRGVNNPSQSAKPKAYLNWILLDEQLKYVSTVSGAVVVGNAGELKPLMPANTLTIPKNGFLYIYVSNETQGWDVFFDNLSVRHFTGPMFEETHYYPFGLTMAGISSKALKPNIAGNIHKFNEGTELNLDLGLDWYETTYRGYDPQIGRFMQVDPMADESADWSPYAYVMNNPILFNDPLGLDTVRINGEGSQKIKIREGDVLAWTIGETTSYYNYEPSNKNAVDGFVGQGIDEGSMSPVTVTANLNKKSSTISQSAGGALTEYWFNDPDLMNEFWNDLKYKNMMVLEGGVGNPLQHLTSAAIRKVISSWSKATFRSVSASLRYHFQKHVAGKGIKKTFQEFTDDAVNFFKNNKHLGKPMQLKDGTMGIKISSGSKQPGGIFTHDGKIVTFWYH